MIQWLSKIWTNPKEEKTEIPMKKFLIVGLGNIGADYVNTRHNIGFKIVDYIASQENTSFEIVKLGALAKFSVKGRQILMLKPNTYMNLSGKAVAYWMEKENIPLENLLIITDDLNLSFGTIRIKPKGSDGGHNGLKSIQQTLGGSVYPRFRFGISDAFKKGQQIDYVLADWTEEEKTALKERYEVSAEVVKTFALSGIEIAMTSFNGK